MVTLNARKPDEKEECENKENLAGKGSGMKQEKNGLVSTNDCCLIFPKLSAGENRKPQPWKRTLDPWEVRWWRFS